MKLLKLNLNKQTNKRIEYKINYEWLIKFNMSFNIVYLVFIITISIIKTISYIYINKVFSQKFNCCIT